MSFRYIDDQDLYASGAYVGLALPGEAGSWQRECKVNQHAMYIIPSLCSQNELHCTIRIKNFILTYCIASGIPILV